MAANTRIFIPRYISDVNYNPTRVNPHIYFYNGQRQCEPWYLEGYSGSATTSSATIIQKAVDTFPQLDYYSKQVPDSSSLSLLFNNEYTPYGTIPSGSLYSEYWNKYVGLLYDPQTRLIVCSAIIPLADYFKMNLNDVVEWRGNYYYLRAINDYNTNNGECNLQLLGPILDDTLTIDFIQTPTCNFDFTITGVISTTTTSTTTAAPSQSTSTTTSTTSTTSTSTTTAALGIVTNGLTLWNNCSSLVNGVWRDISGNGNDAIVSGSIPLQLSGSLGVEFVSSSSNPTYLTYPTNLVATPSSSFTLQFFGSPKYGVGDMTLFGKSSPSASVYSDGWFTAMNANTGSLARIYYYDKFNEEIVTPQITPQATRTLYSFVFNEGFSSGILYINNNISQSLTSGQYVGFNTASVPFTFGYDANGGSPNFGGFVGTVNDITVYNRALSQSEIEQNYSYMISQTCILPTSTTTSTTSTSTSTSTSTTSTTTGAPLNCYQYSIAVTESATYGYIDCYGSFRQIILFNQTANVCASATPFLLSGVAGVVTNLGTCVPSTTSTSTTTQSPTSTTTTTTAAPTSTSTTTSGPTSTTTTSTTTAAPTSTSTTTSGPTTTSTTTLSCNTYNIFGGASTNATYGYYNCFGTFQTVFVGANQTIVICASSAPILISGTPAININTPGACTPTTTTTAAPVCTAYTLTPTAGMDAGYSYTDCDGIIQQLKVKDGWGIRQICSLTYPLKYAGTGNATIANNGNCAYNVNNCVTWEIQIFAPSNIGYNVDYIECCTGITKSLFWTRDQGLLTICTPRYTKPAFGGEGSSVNTFKNTNTLCNIGCPTTTTSTSTTTSTTTLSPNCVTYTLGRCNTPSGGCGINYVDCDGNAQTFNFPYSNTPSFQPCAREGSVVAYKGSFSITAGGNCGPTTTTTTQPPTTSTTTIPYIGSSTTTSTTTAAPQPPTSTSTTTVVWFGYNLVPVAGGTCDATGDSFTAYKYQSGGSINNGDILYASQNVGDPLATGYYSDGGYRYEVNTGVVSNKTACPLPTSTTTSTSTSTTTLPPISGNGTYECASGYTVCNGTFTITSLTGGSGAPYQTSLVLTGNSPVWNNYPAVSSYTGLCGGSNYTFSVKDSNGNTVDNPFTMCFTTSTTSTTSTTTAAPINCALYSVESLDYPNFDVNITWVNCDGTPGNHTIYTTDPNQFYSPPCARVGTIYADGSINVTLISSGCT